MRGGRDARTTKAVTHYSCDPSGLSYSSNVLCSESTSRCTRPAKQAFHSHIHPTRVLGKINATRIYAHAYAQFPLKIETAELLRF